MDRLGIITGSGLYRLDALENGAVERVSTAFGDSSVELGKLGGTEVAAIARHGEGHRLLSNMINHRANLLALKELGVRAVIATSVVGVLEPTIPLTSVILFDDLFFPENRLPGGELCSLFSKPGEGNRGHLIFNQPFSAVMRNELLKAAGQLGITAIGKGVYGHVNGPRFNSRSEISYLRGAGVTAISQTCGPEAILAGELEIPYQLMGFTVDYANGVMDAPTPVDELSKNLEISSEVLPELIRAAVRGLDVDSIPPSGFVYRF